MRVWLSAMTAAVCLAGAPGAFAEVVDKSAAGFELKFTRTIQAPPDKVYAALMKPQAWWSSEHTFSRSAANLRMDLKDHCFCESLPNGGEVRHLEIVYRDGRQLRLSGALGPGLFTGATGHLGFVTADADGQTKLAVTYDVGGYAKGGLAETWSAGFDAVLGEQLDRLKAYVETGSPDTAPRP